jgi:hypothetical protein
VLSADSYRTVSPVALAGLSPKTLLIAPSLLQLHRRMGQRQVQHPIADAQTGERQRLSDGEAAQPGGLQSEREAIR